MPSGVKSPPPAIATSSRSAGNTTGDVSVTRHWLQEPQYQLFGVVFILFLLTAILGIINFCIWYFEKKRRRGPVHWRSAPIGDITLNRPVSQPPKRSFHIQHALYKTVRRPSSMPP